MGVVRHFSFIKKYNCGLHRNKSNNCQSVRGRQNDAWSCDLVFSTLRNDQNSALMERTFLEIYSLCTVCSEHQHNSKQNHEKYETDMSVKHCCNIYAHQE